METREPVQIRACALAGSETQQGHSGKTEDVGETISPVS